MTNLEQKPVAISISRTENEIHLTVNNSVVIHLSPEMTIEFAEQLKAAAYIIINKKLKDDKH